jgi:hypothetical protein
LDSPFVLLRYVTIPSPSTWKFHTYPLGFLLFAQLNTPTQQTIEEIISYSVTAMPAILRIISSDNNNNCVDTPVLPVVAPDKFTYCEPYRPVDYESRTLLETCIRLAEHLNFIKLVKGAPIFPNAYTVPRLHSGKPKRILVCLVALLHLIGVIRSFSRTPSYEPTAILSLRCS